MRNTISFVWMSMLVTACATDTESENRARITGTATYRDASTDHAGNTKQADVPPAQAIDLEIVVEGTGELPQIDPQCALDPAGAFEARYASTAQLGADHAYVATIAESSGTIATPSGCLASGLTVGVITGAKIRAHLATTTPNCETFCAANARAEAEQSCGASAAAASCRADAETQAAARCTTTCTTRAAHITAEVSLAAALLGQLDAEALEAAALGELQANVTFDRMTDANGDAL